MYGFIYVRQHPSYSYDKRICCKLGKAINYVDRDSTYATGEIVRGVFTNIYEVPIDKMDIIEKLAHMTFKEYNVRFDGGQEFYTINIVDMLDSFFDKMNHILKIKIRKLDQKEINDMLRTKRKKIIKDENEDENEIEYLYELYKNYSSSLIVPRKDQEEIINKALEYYKDPMNTKGILVIPCGVGKTMISLWISLRLNIDLKSIIIGVPNRLLLKQWEKVVKLLFPEFKCFLVDGNVDKDYIRSNLGKKCIVITTYASSFKFLSLKDFTFDVKILDEVHHLTSKKNEEQRKTFIKILDIKSTKQISLTATLKILDYNEYDENTEEYISNDNVEYFGEIIDRKCLLWAINENIICDYVIQTIITNEEQLEQQLSRFHIIEENDKRLFLSAFASLKSIFDGHSHHLLIYSNNKDNSLKLIQYIKMLLDDNYFDMPDLYYSNYHSEMKSKDQKEIINNFEKAKFGIITCVYCLGEGWDFPLLDGVVFAENMTSNIRIVQSALRASRKNKKDINKKTKIILPILNRDDWLENNENPDLKKVREVIYQMGLEDETITQKIKVFRIDIEKQKPKTREKEEREMVDEFGEYDDELTQKLRLKTIKRTALATTYEKARKIIADKNIKSKESYYELCERDNRLSKEPEIVFKGQFTNWIEYLSIERVYYDLETCKNKVGEYLLLYPEIKKHYLDLSIVSNELCKKDALFPPNGLWVEYYNVKDLRELITITNKKKKMGVIL